MTPGRRVLVAGNGPLNAQVACELLDAGVEVVAWVEAAPWIGADRGMVPSSPLCLLLTVPLVELHHLLVERFLVVLVKFPQTL